MTERTIYILGRVFGRMVSELNVKNPDVILHRASNYPMQEITILHMTKMNRYSDELTKFINAMMKQIPEDEFESINERLRPLERGPFILGFETGRNPFDYETEMAIRRITQQQLADNLGVTRMTVSRWLSNGIPADRKCDVEIAIYSLSGKIGNGYDYIEPKE